MSFDKFKDSIAITVPEFTLKKDSEGWFDKYNEPYILSLAVDKGGEANPEISFNFMPFPKVREGDTVNMLGDGHIVYGPKNPGEFVAVSLLFMENDDDVRELGKQIEDIVKSKAVDLGMRVVLASHPGAAGVLAILKELTLFVSGVLKKNSDDKLFRVEGTFLQGSPVPYHVNRSYTRENEFISTRINVVPMDAANGQGVTPIAIHL